jgi:nitroimidazol reductase NimA-like FMN-containing flavoprotein (pyridoxamine 5'-phosphate oxidase superfamily)
MRGTKQAPCNGGIIMRVSKKEIKDRVVIIELLSESPVGRLSTIGKDGYPVIKPLNFVYCEGSIYFHSAKEGEKIEDIVSDSRVCFEIDRPIAYVKSTGIPCKADYLYRSVIIKGRANIVDDRHERLTALRKLMEKYQPEGGYGDFSEEKVVLAAIVRIDIEVVTGKEDLGKETERKAVLRFFNEKHLSKRR